MGSDDLTTADLKKLLTRDSADSIEELYGFGVMLLNECVDRTKQLDTKAAALTGYGGVIIAILVSAFSSRVGTLRRAEWYPLIAAGICAVCASGFALQVLRIRRFQWFSDFDWFAPSVIKEPHRLKQSHMLAMHRYKHQHDGANSDKASYLWRAYICLMLSGALLLIALLGPKVLDVIRPLVCPSC
jgi:hypothetical protein